MWNGQILKFEWSDPCCFPDFIEPKNPMQIRQLMNFNIQILDYIEIQQYNTEHLQ